MHRLLLALALAAALAGCGGGGEKVSGPPPAAPAKIKLTSPAFAANDTIPKQFTCDGQNVSPPLQWSGVPKGAASLALLVEDPDAPGGTFVHWSLFAIRPSATRLAAGDTPTGAKQGENSFGKEGYGGPCPPKGDSPHRYVFTLYALREQTDLSEGAKPVDVRSEVARTALARGQLIAKYGR